MVGGLVNDVQRLGKCQSHSHTSRQVADGGVSQSLAPGKYDHFHLQAVVLDLRSIAAESFPEKKRCVC
jgi:hypothetical protein